MTILLRYWKGDGGALGQKSDRKPMILLVRDLARTCEVRRTAKVGGSAAFHITPDLDPAILLPDPCIKTSIIRKQFLWKRGQSIHRILRRSQELRTKDQKSED
jgi:hypothetical protein